MAARARRPWVLITPHADQTRRLYYYAGSRRLAVRELAATTNRLYFLQADHLGSTSLAACGTTGAVTARQYYYPYGSIGPGGTGTLPTTYGFTGQRRDATGLMYYVARYYDPYLNRWIQPDSIVPNPYNPQDLNRYSYVRNNPTKYTDPTGHVCFPCALFLVGVALTVYEVFANPDVAYAPGPDVDISQLPPSNQPGDDIALCAACYYAEQGNYAAAAIAAGVEVTPLDEIPGATRVLRHYLRHVNPGAFTDLMGLGARNRNEILSILNGAGTDTIIRGITDRAGNQIVLSAGNRKFGLRHILGGHLTGELAKEGDTFFSGTLKVGDVIDLISQTIQNGSRTRAQNGKWMYTWTHDTWGEIMVIVDESGEVWSAFPTQ